MGSAEDYRTRYERWSNSIPSDDELEEQNKVEIATIYYGVNGYSIWKYPRRGGKREKVFTAKTLYDAQNFILSQDRSLVAREMTDHWLIRFVDQYGTAHFQRWDVDRAKMADSMKPTCGWGYTDEYISWAKKMMSKSELWRPPFIVDGIYTDETWDD